MIKRSKFRAETQMIDEFDVFPADMRSLVKLPDDWWPDPIAARRTAESPFTVMDDARP